MYFEIYLIYYLSSSTHSLNILNLTNDYQESKASAIAISQVIDEFYTKNQIRFDIAYIKHPKKSYEIFTNILRLNNGNFKYVLSTFDDDLPNSIYLVQSAFFFLDSCDDISLLHSAVQLKNSSPKKLKFLVYVNRCGLEKLKRNIFYLVETKKLNFEHGFFEVFEFLLIDDGNFIYLASVEWFTEFECNEIQLIVLNTFNKKLNKWSKEVKNYEKFMNFHGCGLRLGIINNTVASCWGRVLKKPKGLTSVGVKPDLFELISKVANYSPSYVYDISGSIYDTDVFFHNYLLRSFWKSDIHMTASFIEAREIIITTPGELYTSYEKLWLPFDHTTWKYLIITFVVAFTVILIINRFPKSIQVVVFGKNVSTPSLNIIGSFFGISQFKLPTSSAARILLIYFIYFCLIFRTCYQSKMFEFLTSELRKSPPQSIEELKDKGFKMFWTNGTFQESQDVFTNNRWPKIITVDDRTYFKIFYTYSKNASAKIAMMTFEMNLQLYERHGFKVNWLRLKNQNLFVSQTGFGFMANNYFFHIVDETIQKLVPIGIMDHFIEKCFPMKRIRNDRKEPKVLKLENLDFGFFIWLCCCGVDTTCFAIEVIFWILSKKLKLKKNQKKLVKIKFAKIGPELNEILEIRNIQQKDCNLFRIHCIKNDILETTKTNLILVDESLTSFEEDDQKVENVDIEKY